MKKTTKSRIKMILRHMDKMSKPRCKTFQTKPKMNLRLGGSFLAFFLLTFILPSRPAISAADGLRTPPAKDRPIWLVVTRPMFGKCVIPLASRRRSEGFEIIILTLPVARAIGSCPRKPSFLLLLGDYEPGKEDQPWFVNSVVKKRYHWLRGQAKTFASDMAWGDLDGDGAADIPVGRLPARTVAQAELMIRKISQYETRQPSQASLTLPIWAGDGRYGPIFERLSTPLLLGIVRSHGPGYLQPWILNGARNTPFTGWPAYQPAVFNMLLRQATGLACMIGHGSATEFFAMTSSQHCIGYVAEYARRGLARPPAGPATIILACQCGNFAQPRPCLAESMLLPPGGPAAVVAATADSHPLPNMLTGQCLLAACKPGTGIRRLGTLWLGAVRRAGKTRHFLVKQLLTNIEGSLEKNINSPKLFRDQILMYAILGDPAMPLPIPRLLKARVERTAKGWRFFVEKPAGATKLIVSLRKPNQPLPQPTNKPKDRQAAMKTLQAANDTFVFKLQSELPAEAEWTGKIDQPGLLRLVALTPGSIHAATFKLPNKKPSCLR